MKISSTFVSLLASSPRTRWVVGMGIGSFAIAMTSVILPQTGIAQMTPPPSSQEPDLFEQNNERDAIGGELGEGLSLFDMIHDYQLGGNRDMNEFMLQQQQNIDNAATEFKRQQLQQLGQPQQQQQANPVTPSEIGN